jgi:hypothetical protein
MASQVLRGFAPAGSLQVSAVGPCQRSELPLLIPVNWPATRISPRVMDLLYEREDKILNS